MTRKWGAVLGHDPFYNPNLTKQAEDYGLAFPAAGGAGLASKEGQGSALVPTCARVPGGSRAKPWPSFHFLAIISPENTRTGKSNESETGPARRNSVAL